MRLVIEVCGPTERATEAIFSIALYPKWVSLFFLQAKGLPDPDRILKGSGSVAKHVVLASPDVLHYPAVRALMQDAEARAKVAFDLNGEHRLIIKSVSAKQRPRRPAEKETVAACTAEKMSTGRREHRAALAHYESIYVYCAQDADLGGLPLADGVAGLWGGDE